MKTEIVVKVEGQDEINPGDFYIGKHTGDLFLRCERGYAVTVANIGNRLTRTGNKNPVGNVFHDLGCVDFSMHTKVKKIKIEVEI